MGQIKDRFPIIRIERLLPEQFTRFRIERYKELIFPKIWAVDPS